jgi:hypothetical protein
LFNRDPGLHPVLTRAPGTFSRPGARSAWRRRGQQVVGEHVLSEHGGDRYELIYASRKPGYELGVLDDARANFEQKTGITADWDMGDDIEDDGGQGLTLDG